MKSTINITHTQPTTYARLSSTYPNAKNVTTILRCNSLINEGIPNV